MRPEEKRGNGNLFLPDVTSFMDLRCVFSIETCFASSIFDTSKARVVIPCVWMEPCEVLSDGGRHPLLPFILFFLSCCVLFCTCSHRFCLWLMSADGRQIKNVARDVGALTLNSCGDLWAAVWEQAAVSLQLYHPLSELHTRSVCCFFPIWHVSYQAFAKIQH